MPTGNNTLMENFLAMLDEEEEELGGVGRPAPIAGEFSNPLAGNFPNPVTQGPAARPGIGTALGNLTSPVPARPTQGGGQFDFRQEILRRLLGRGRGVNRA